MLKRIATTLMAVLCIIFAIDSASAATLSQKLNAQLKSLSGSASVGVVIITFNTSNGLNASHLSALLAVGITKGIMLKNLGMVAAPATAAQVKALSASPAVRSIWSNDQLSWLEVQTNTLTGVDRLRNDAAITRQNGGLPVSGHGNFSVVINDSGIDARHDDLKFGSHVVQNVQILTDTATLSGFTSLVTVENVPDTDLNVGHGTHCAGIVGGSGQDSGGLYEGVAPGAKLIGTGSGAVLFILNGLGGFEWSLANQSTYGIRIISNSWGGNGPFDPSDPINIATKAAHDHNIIVAFAAGNSGPGKNTMNPYAKAPWVIGVAAGTKEGGLASFSSRGTPKEERLNDNDPNNDFDAPTITAPGTGREFAGDAGKFTSDVVSTRSITNVFANGETADTELPTQYIPFYTQISGTSMATPYVAGTAALMLEADPTLSPDDVKQIIVDTASNMPGYDDFEVGAGYINAYAAVDKVFNRSKAYGTLASTVNFLMPQFTVSGPTPQNVEINYTPLATPGPGSANSTNFTVQAGMTVLDVFATFDNAAMTGDGNTIGILLTDPKGTTYSSGIALPILDSPSREVVVKNPIAGQWLLEVRGVRGLTTLPGVSLPTSGAATPGPVNITITQQLFTLAPISDIQGHAAQAEIENVLKNKQMDLLPDGLFHPDMNMFRKDFARLLYLNTPLRQSLAATQVYTDVGPEIDALAEAVTANGSNLRDYDFTPKGMLSGGGPSFNSNDNITRLDVVVALVRALGLDADAQSKAGTNVTVNYNGQTITLSDNSDIPAALRGYVQDALDRNLLQATFTLQQGQFDFSPTVTATFNPNGTVTRALMAYSLDNFRQHFVVGN
ncbi:MAG TPA: S8 family serine peptidase [Blastocatellia bacterium]|nr:S8 family serine peptidase [Blastocatellia bacterium]